MLHVDEHADSGSKPSGFSLARLVKRVKKTKRTGNRTGREASASGSSNGLDNGTLKDQGDKVEVRIDSDEQCIPRSTQARPKSQPFTGANVVDGVINADSFNALASTSVNADTPIVHNTAATTVGADSTMSGGEAETFTWSRRVDYLLKAYGVPDLTGAISPDSQRHVSTLTKIGHAHSDRPGLAMGVVALKSLPQKWEDDAERLIRAIAAWSALSHPNLHRLYGLAKPRLNTRLVSPWMVNGNVADFLAKHRNVPPLRVAAAAAAGLAYLHEQNPPVTHGNLRTSNILIGDAGEPVISDLDLNLIGRDLGASQKSTRTDAMGVRNPWGLAPELLFEDAPPDPRSDVYAFGMVVLEITALAEPFSEIAPLNSARLIVHVYGGGRPARPTAPAAIARGLDDALWALLERCWARAPADRPTAYEAQEALAKLAMATDGVQAMHDKLRETVPDLTGRIVLVDGMQVVGGGSFGDIRVANLKEAGKVVLKSLRPGSWAPPTRLTKRFIREASVWSTLTHPNVLPFLGIAEPPGVGVCLVSPWMANGNAFDYLSKNRDVSPFHIATGVAQGLAYLHAHTPQVIHGDLRSANIVVSDSGDALICDFGLAIVVEDLARLPLSTALKGEGNPRWMAPELLVRGEQPGAGSDVYALGMSVLELFSLAEPFAEFRRAPQVVLHVFSGGRPARPRPRTHIRATSNGNDIAPSSSDAESDRSVDATARGLDDVLWALLSACWAEMPADRPSAAEVWERLAALEAKHERDGGGSTTAI